MAYTISDYWDLSDEVKSRNVRITRHHEAAASEWHHGSCYEAKPSRGKGAGQEWETCHSHRMTL
jgi:hypothetical protein